MDEISAHVKLAEHITDIAQRLGIETALIGAGALAVHHHRRGTDDIDLASAVDPFVDLGRLEKELRTLGLHAERRTPDAEDKIGGVLVVWQHEDEEGEPLDPVEVVNFHNPFRPRRNPGKAAIKNAVPIEHSSLRCVRLPDLIALKLYAGSRHDLADIGELLVRNPDADLDEIRAVAGPYDETGELETLFAEAAARRARR